jgi:hypothetical protein
VDGDGKGFEEGGCVERDVIWDSELIVSEFFNVFIFALFHLLVTPDRGMVYPFLKGTLEMRDALCTTSKPHLLT